LSPRELSKSLRDANIHFLFITAKIYLSHTFFFTISHTWQDTFSHPLTFPNDEIIIKKRQVPKKITFHIFIQTILLNFATNKIHDKSEQLTIQLQKSKKQL
jgi:hypothetical protein